MVENTMEVSGWLRKQLAQASPDLLREMVQDFAEALMGAEADALCGAAYGERSPERVNTRNGYRRAALGHPRRHDRARDPEAAGGQLLPRLAADSRAGAPSRRWLSVVAELPGRRLHPADREARPDARDRADLEEPGLADGQAASTSSSRPSAPGRSTTGPTPT